MRTQGGGKPLIDASARSIASSGRHTPLTGPASAPWEHGPVRRYPFRSPLAVADAIQDIVSGRVVCDLGCAEGDFMAMLAQHARRVIGFDMNPRRYRKALRRGFTVVPGNYHLDELPEADVYYLWADNVARDAEFVVDKILARPDFRGTIVVGADCNVPSEAATVTRCALRGRLLRIPFDEGPGYREQGTFLLAIIDGDAHRQPSESDSSERRAVVSLAVGDGFGDLAALSIPGQQAYASRLGADHIVLRRPVIKSSSPFYEIFQVHRLFEDYERILYLDLDVLVRDDCPDLFACVPHDALGVFLESRLVDRGSEIRRIQTLWPALGWTEDYFNNGVMIASRLHQDLFRPEAGLPGALRFSDQTVMNYRAAARRLDLYDIGFNLNYMPAILPRGHVLRFFHSLVGPAIWPVPHIYQAPPEPENARVVHGAGFSYRLKKRLAERTLALWKHRRGMGFTAAHRRLNRVWGGLVPKMVNGVTLEEGARPVLVRSSGDGRPLEDVEAETVRQCDGSRTSAQIARSVCTAFPDHPPDRLVQSVRRSLNTFLDDGYLEATNQAEPPFSHANEHLESP